MNELKQKKKRPVGRPRADGREHLAPDDLLRVTAKLIAQNGYTGTSFRMIAKELDVTIASIFHLYPSKEKLLIAMISYASRPSLDFYGQLDASTAQPAAKLFKAIVEEFRAVSSVDRDFVAIFYLPELRRPEFATAQQIRAQMVDQYRKLIRQGVMVGSLEVADEVWSAEQIFQLTETNIIAGNSIDAADIDRRALETARFCMRGLLKDQGQLDDIESEAAKVDASIVVDEQSTTV